MSTKAASTAEASSKYSLWRKPSLLLLMLLTLNSFAYADPCHDLLVSELQGLKDKFVQKHGKDIMLFNLRFRPSKTLAPLKEGVLIQGTMKMSKAEAHALQDDIILFDDFYQSLGFAKAWKTRVLMLEENRFNTGPFAVPEPLKLGLWPFNSDYWLNLVVEPSDAIDFRQIPSVLFHERAHLIISSHFYSEESPFAHPVPREAMADILTAHYLDDPVIGRVPSESKFIRNIDTRQAITVANPEAKLLKTMAELSDAKLTPHEESLFISSFLWRIRQAVGLETFGRFLLVFAQHVERYSLEYSLLDRGKFDSFNSIDFYYAIVKITAKDMAIEDKVLPAADAYIAELEASPDQALIQKFFEKIKK